MFAQKGWYSNIKSWTSCNPSNYNQTETKYVHCLDQDVWQFIWLTNFHTIAMSPFKSKYSKNIITKFLQDWISIFGFSLEVFTKKYENLFPKNLMISEKILTNDNGISYTCYSIFKHHNSSVPEILLTIKDDSQFN